MGLVLPLLLACPLAASDAWTLHQNLLEWDRLEVKARVEGLVEPARRAVATLEATTRFEGVIVGPADSGDGVTPRVVLGLAGDPGIVNLVPLMRSLDGGGFVVAGRPFRQPGDVLIATFEDPVRSGLPLTVMAGNRFEELAHHVRVLDPVWQPGLRVLRDGELVLRAELATDGTLAEDGLEDLLAARGAAPRGVTTLRAQGISMTVPGAPGDAVGRRLRAYAERCSNVRAETARILRGHVTNDIDLRVSLRAEDVHRRQGELLVSIVHQGTPDRVRALVEGGMQHDGGAAVAGATALRLLGPTHEDWLLDGVGTWIAGTWWGWPLHEWVAFLEDNGLTATAAELLDPRKELTLSQHVLRPLRAFLVGVLLQEAGPGGVRDVWSGERELVLDDALEAAFRDALERNAAVLVDRLAARRDERRERALERDFRAGVCLAVDVRDGEEEFLARGFEDSLDRAAELGADAIALTFFVFQEPRPRRWAGEPVRGPFDATLSDLAIQHVVGEARARGMDVLLSPQLLATPAGTWTDGHGLASVEEVELFFGELERMLTHYALVAELSGCDVFCLGAGRRQATRTRAEEGDEEVVLEIKAAKHDGWARTIDSVAPIFGGALTYAADDGGEIAGFEFWERLDLVGLNAFPSLPGFAGPEGRKRSRGVLERSFRRGLAVAREADRPLLVTQIGFPSHTEAAEHPLVARGTVDLREQQRLYTLLADVLDELRREGPAAERLAGLYLWRWDASPFAGGTADPGHTPQNKPAEALVPRILGR